MKNKSNQIFTSMVLFLLIVGTLILSGCIDDNEDMNTSFHYSFEKNMEDWMPDGTDLSDPPINWSIEPTDEQASHENRSIRLYLNNLNDAGKIWMERPFTLEPNKQYELNLSYQFATQDFGDFNLFTIVAGVSTKNPETIEDLMFQDDTGHHQDQDVGYVWLNKSYTFTIQTNDSGMVYVMIGVWGTWETPRTYYVDNVNISFSTVSLASFPNLSGNWKISYYDFMGNVTNTENVSIIQQNETLQMVSGNETLFSTVIYKNNLASPNDVSEYVILDCDFRGLGIDYIYVYNDSYLKTNLPLCENCQPAVFTKIS